MSEQWRPVVGYEGHYMVSDDGCCASIRTRGGKPRWRLLSPAPSSTGYVRYALCRESERKDFSAHRLTWMAFNGAIPGDLQINHKNGIKTDNRLANLELVTCSDNNKHRYRVLGVEPTVAPNPGSKNGRSKLTERDIPRIRELLKSGVTQTAIARMFEVDQTQISLIARGKSWRHVGASG